MGRRVKCYATGEYGTSDTFIKIKDHYYKSQEVYDRMVYNRKVSAKIEEIILFDFLHYTPGQPFPSIIKRKLKELEFYEPDIILQTIRDVSKSLEYMLEAKDFDSEYNKIAYIFGAIKNHINEVYQKSKAEEKRKNMIIESEALDELSGMMNTMVNQNVNRVAKRASILEFVGEEEK